MASSEPSRLAGSTNAKISAHERVPRFAMKRFLDDDFLLDTPVAIDLYEKFARSQPIIDYHCHLPPDQIADNHRFQTLTEIWLKGDHYKWRAMRTNGVPERLI